MPEEKLCLKEYFHHRHLTYGSIVFKKLRLPSPDHMTRIFLVTVPENGEIRGEGFRLQPPWEIALWDVMLPPGKDDTFLPMGAPHLSKSHHITHVGVCT